jgi:hypothetical protein
MANYKFSVLGLLLLLFSLDSFGQEFLGIKVDGKLNEVVTKFKQKGFKITSPDSNNPILKGKAGNLSVEIVIFSSPITKTVYKLTVYLPEQTTWASIKSDYQDYLTTLTNKYGTPESTYDFFESPYEEGNGDEMLGVEMEKCHYSAFWSNVSLFISKFKQIKISYENDKNFQIRDKEESKLKKDIF